MFQALLYEAIGQPNGAAAEADLLQGALRSFAHPASRTWRGRSFREALSSHAMEKAKKCSWKRFLLSTLRSGSSYSCELLQLWVSSGIVQTTRCIHCVCVCVCTRACPPALAVCSFLIRGLGDRLSSIACLQFSETAPVGKAVCSLCSLKELKKKKNNNQMESWNFNVDM